ncbi:MAG: hypothetical protein QNJ64_14255 [Crocosphaera sp.]|nr:hypothetical protein [Crocosphaera sp.]
MNNYFEQYKIIKKKLSYNYKGYNLGDIIACDLIVHIYFEKKKDIEEQPYRKILLPLKQSPYIGKLHEILDHDGILIAISQNYNARSDYSELVRLINEKVNRSIIAVLNIKNKTKLMRLYSWEFIVFILSFLRNYIQVFRIFSIKETLYFTCLLHTYKSLIDDLENIKTDLVKIKKYITFNGALRYENLLIQFFKKRSIPTYSLQHAIMDAYFLNTKFPPHDLINIENLDTNYLLCWSQGTIDQIMKYQAISSELLLVGNPKYSRWKINNIKQSFKKCLVFLGGRGGEVDNLEIIKIVQQLSTFMKDTDFTFKLHPQYLNDSYYERIIAEQKIKLCPSNQTLSSLLVENEFDFTICYNLTTTVYYESLCYGLVSFRYNPDNIANVYGLSDDNFRTAEELAEKISHFQQLDANKLLVEIQDILQYTVGVNIDNYNQCLS